MPYDSLRDLSEYFGIIGKVIRHFCPILGFIRHLFLLDFSNITATLSHHYQPYYMETHNMLNRQIRSNSIN